jgi:hypothetical protein
MIGVGQKIDFPSAIAPERFLYKYSDNIVSGVQAMYLPFRRMLGFLEVS